MMFFNASFSIFTDLVTVGLPMPVLSTLTLPIKQKIGLVLVFALGGFACLVSILRLRAISISVAGNDLPCKPPLFPSATILITQVGVGHNVDIAVWSNIEVNVGIICASLPAVKPVVSRFFPHLLSSNKSKLTYPSHTRNHRSSMFTSGHSQPFRLDDFDLMPNKNFDPSGNKTVTRVEASERTVVNDENWNGDGRGIVVSLSTRQDIESRGRGDETGSEKDLIFQR